VYNNRQELRAERSHGLPNASLQSWHSKVWQLSRQLGRLLMSPVICIICWKTSYLFYILNPNLRKKLKNEMTSAGIEPRTYSDYRVLQSSGLLTILVKSIAIFNTNTRPKKVLPIPIPITPWKWKNIAIINTNTFSNTLSQVIKHVKTVCIC